MLLSIERLAVGLMRRSVGQTRVLETCRTVGILSQFLAIIECDSVDVFSKVALDLVDKGDDVMFTVQAVLIITLTTGNVQSVEYLQLPTADACEASRMELVKFGPPDGAARMRVRCAPLKVYTDFDGT